MKLLATLLAIAIEAILIVLAQSDIVPSDLVSIFIQLPLIGLFAWYVLKKDKDTREWIDHLMDEQERRYNRTIDLFEKIATVQSDRQEGYTESIKKLTEQLTINTATINESMRLNELMEELGKK